MIDADLVTLLRIISLLCFAAVIGWLWLIHRGPLAP